MEAEGVLDKHAVEVDPSPRGEWDAYVRNHPQGSAYHLAAWAEVLERAYRFSPQYLTRRDGDGRISGVMPLVYARGPLSGSRLNSLPAMRWAGPLADGDAGRVELLEQARAMVDAGKADRLHILSPESDLEEVCPWLSASESHPAWAIPLPGDMDAFEATFKHRSKSFPRQVRKARREGVIVRLATSDRDLRDFYTLYLKTMRRRRAVPRSLKQLQVARDLMGPPGTFRLLVAEYEGQVIAGSLFNFFENEADLMYNASDDRFLSLRPNHALQWEAIRQAIDEGMGLMDLGVAREDTSLAEFKRRWGAERVSRYAIDYPRRSEKRAAITTATANSVRRSRSRLIRGAWERAPLTLTRAAGFVSYRYL